MSKLIHAIAIAPLLIGGVAVAQTTAPSTTSPSTTSPSSPSTAPSASPPMTGPSTASPSASQNAATLTDDEAKRWMDKVVYSSDNKNVGEVGAMQRDSSGRITELHVDTGGFLGIGETRVKVMPSQFKLEGDRVVLNLTSEQVKGLPKVAK